jgi:hypothetical protein
MADEAAPNGKLEKKSVGTAKIKARVTSPAWKVAIADGHRKRTLRSATRISAV